MSDGDNIQLKVEDDILKELEETDWTEDVPEEGGDEHLDTSLDNTDMTDDFDLDELECVDEAEVDDDKSRRDRERRSLRHRDESSRRRDINRRDKTGERRSGDRNRERSPDRRASDRHHNRSSRDRDSDRARRISSPMTAPASIHKRARTSASAARLARDKQRREEFLRRKRGEETRGRRSRRDDEVELDELEEVDCCDDEEDFSDLASDTTDRTGSYVTGSADHNDIGNAALEGLDDDELECPLAARLSSDGPAQTVSIDLDVDDLFPDLCEDIDVEAVKRAAALPTSTTIAAAISPTPSSSSNTTSPSVSIDKDSPRRSADGRRKEDSRSSSRMEQHRRAPETPSSSRRGNVAVDSRPNHPKDSRPPARAALFRKAEMEKRRRIERERERASVTGSARAADAQRRNADMSAPLSAVGTGRKRRSSPLSQRPERRVRETASPIRRRHSRPTGRVSPLPAEPSRPMTPSLLPLPPAQDTVAVVAFKDVPAVCSPPKKTRIEFNESADATAPRSSSTRAEVRPSPVAISRTEGNGSAPATLRPAVSVCKPVRERIVFDNGSSNCSTVATSAASRSIAPSMQTSSVLSRSTIQPAVRRQSAIAPPTRQQLRDLVIRLDIRDDKQNSSAAARRNNGSRRPHLYPAAAKLSALTRKEAAAAPALRKGVVMVPSTASASAAPPTMLIERRFRKGNQSVIIQ